MDEARDRRARGRPAAWAPWGPGLLAGALLALPAAGGALGGGETLGAQPVALLAPAAVGIAAGVALRPAHRGPKRSRAASVLGCGAAALALALGALALGPGATAAALLVAGVLAGWGLPRAAGGRTPVVAALVGLLLGVGALPALTSSEGLPVALGALAALAALAAVASALTPPAPPLGLVPRPRGAPRAPLCELALAAAAIGAPPVAGGGLAESRGWPPAAAGVLLAAAGLAGAFLALATAGSSGPAPGAGVFGVARSSAPVVASTAAMAAAASTGVTAALAPLAAVTVAVAVGPWALGRLRTGDLALAGAVGPLLAAAGMAAGGTAAGLAFLAAVPLAAWVAVALADGDRAARRGVGASEPRERIRAALAEAAPSRDPSSPGG